MVSVGFYNVVIIQHQRFNMNIEKHIPATINNDDSERYLHSGEALAIQNCRLGLSLNGKDLRIENIPSSLLLSNPYIPLGDNTCIGSVVDTNRRRIIYAIYNSGGADAIYAYDIALNIFYIVIKSSQIQDPLNINGVGLNFSLSNYIDRNMRIIGDMLIWLDGGDPKCINIEAGIKSNTPGYVSNVLPYDYPMSYDEITLIKRPPINRLLTSKAIDSLFVNNFIADYAFQFTYFYGYRYGQNSALAPYSDLVNYNNNLNTTETFNYIVLSVPIVSWGEKIPDDLQTINLCAKFGNTGKTFIIKTWDRRNPEDAAAIHSSVIGYGDLKYNFYNNTIGIALDDVSSVNNFDDVPLQAETVEVAKNRVFLGNVLSGYDTPATTSIQGVGAVLGGADINDFWHETIFWTGYIDSVSLEFIQVTHYDFNFVHVNGLFYDYGTVPIVGVVNLSDALHVTSTWADLLAIYWTPGSDGNPSTDPANPPTDNTTTSNVLIHQNLITTPYEFKCNSYYKLGITFFDRFRRKCGIVTADTSIVNIPERDYAPLSSFYNVINWSLSNTNAATEIPNWAYYYQIGMTKNQVFSFFLESNIGQAANYVTKNSSGVYDFTGTTYSSATFGVAFDISTLISNGQGYVFTEGDLMTVYRKNGATTLYNFRVLDASSKWIIVNPVDMGTLPLTAPDALIISVYTPYAPTANEPFYEVSPTYKVLNPTTVFAKYSTTSDYINGDVYHVTATDIQAMSPNTKHWMDWERNLGWINNKDYIGQQQLSNTIVFSDTFIQGTQTNGLNKFQPLNSQSLTSESGDIKKLILTNKIAQDLGTIMLCICENEPLSIYLGETQLVSQDGNAYVAQSVGVIGTINALRGNFGTMHPESVIDYLGEVYWFDIQHGSWIQYSANGATIVNWKLNSYFKKFSTRYLEQGLKLRIISCIDPVRRQLMVCMPATESTSFPYTLPSYGGVVPSYASTIQSQFKIYDGQAKTIFMGIDDNAWRYSLGILPAWVEYAENKMYGFTSGNLHQFEGGSDFNTFLGLQLPVRLAIVASQNPNSSRYSYNPSIANAIASQYPNVLKDLYNISIEGNSIPDYVVAYVDYPNEQITDLTATDMQVDGTSSWQNIDGVMYASFLRDRLSPNVVGTPEQKMYAGDQLRSVTPKIMTEFRVYNRQLAIDAISIGYEIVTGHIKQQEG